MDGRFERPPIPPRRLFDRRTVLFLVVAGFLWGSLVLVLRRPPEMPARPAAAARSVEREAVNQLKGKRLYGEAARVYEEYLAKTALPEGEFAKAAFELGEIYVELGQYERAIGWFYKAQAAGLEEALQPRLGSDIVKCFESLGRTETAQAELSQRAAIRPSAANPVVAKIGDRQITMDEFNAEIDKLAREVPGLRAQLQSPEQKLQFLRQYVFKELLCEKAKRLGLDKDPSVTARLAEIEKQVIFERILEREIEDKVKVADEDVKNYYEAHRSRYVQKARARAAHILVKTEDEANKLLDELKAGKDFAELAKTHSLDKDTAAKGGEFPEEFTEGGAASEELSKAIFAADAGTVIPKPVKTEDGYHVVKVLAKTPAVQLPFEQVKSTVENDYRNMKRQVALEELLKKTISENDVIVYEEPFTGEKPVLKNAK